MVTIIVKIIVSMIYCIVLYCISKKVYRPYAFLHPVFITYIVLTLHITHYRHLNLIIT